MRRQADRLWLARFGANRAPPSSGAQMLCSLYRLRVVHRWQFPHGAPRCAPGPKDSATPVSPDGTVTLLGEVSRPTLKSDAERAVGKIEGVERVDNQIKVLPVSSNDDRIRRARYRNIYGHSVLSLYQLRAVPPIHIIVDNGHVKLEGAVARQMEKQVAGMQANSVSGVFSVENNLRVEND
jgi:hypothetical protein